MIPMFACRRCMLCRWSEHHVPPSYPGIIQMGWWKALHLFWHSGRWTSCILQESTRCDTPSSLIDCNMNNDMECIQTYAYEVRYTLNRCLFGFYINRELCCPLLNSKGNVGYPWERSRDIYQHRHLYGLYNGCIMASQPTPPNTSPSNPY